MLVLPLLLNLLYCQVGRIVKPAVLPGLAVLLSLPYCQIYCLARSSGSVGFAVFLPVYLRCNYLGTWCFWRCLAVNCLQLAQVRRSVFSRRPKNIRFGKMCLWIACMADFTKSSVPRFLHRGRQPSLPTNSAMPAISVIPVISAIPATSVSFLLFCHFCHFCHFFFSYHFSFL